MAEYFSLLERAVAGLQDASPASRRAIYDRARNALLGQLRAMQPPVPEADIQRESAALDQAIARLEERIGRERPRAAPSSPAASRPAAAPEPPAPAPGLPIGIAPAVAAPMPPERAVPGPAAAGKGSRRIAAPIVSAPPGEVARAEPAAPRRPAPAKLPGAPARPRNLVNGDTALPPAAGPEGAFAFEPVAEPPVTPAAATDESAPGGVPHPGEPSPVLPVAPTLEVPGLDPSSADQSQAEAASGESNAKRAFDRGSRPGRDMARPAAPRPASVEPRSAGVYVVAGLAVLLVIGIAIAAWKLRDRPEQVIAAQTETASTDSPGKIADRVTGDAAGAPSTNAPATNPQPPSDAATVPPPVPQSTEQPAASPAQAPAAAETAPSTPPIAVSQRAALLVDAPDEPQKIKTYVGSVVWHSESVSPGQDQPLSTAVRCDVDIPDAKLTMSMVLKKNMEAQFPASHTMELHFAEQPGNTLGPIKQISVPEMRKDDSAPSGDPLVGVPVSITDDYFLVGLSRGAAEMPNLRMMTDRNWIDVGVIFKSGKVAKVTFEKGTSGQQVLEDALKSWQ